jgi:hypothetical protein
LPFTGPKYEYYDKKKKTNALLVTSAPAALPENAEETKYVSLYRQQNVRQNINKNITEFSLNATKFKHLGME